MAELLNASSPASFGQASETIVDESVRKAFALAPEHFALTKDIVGKALLESIGNVLMPESEEVTAQLYKLNVYGPGGHFAAHVDTPRSKLMFGSLVVCLPSPFTGGELVVRGSNRDEVVLDWAPKANEKIQCVAFYSDCEHEIRPITSGHRITLTYNLLEPPSKNDTRTLAFLKALVGEKAPPNVAEIEAKFLGRDPTVNIIEKDVGSTTQMASIQSFKSAFEDALSNSAFMPEGGLIGFPCTQTYVEEVGDDTPLSITSLKGIDLLIYTTLRGLKLPTTLHRIVSKDDADRTNSLEDLSHRMWNYNRSPFYITIPVLTSRYQYHTNDKGKHDRGDKAEVVEYLEVLIAKDDVETQMMVRKELDEPYQYEEGGISSIFVEHLKEYKGRGNSYWEGRKEDESRKRKREEEEEKIKDALKKRFVVEPVYWLKPFDKSTLEEYLSVIKYGNEASQGYLYATACLLIRIPAFGTEGRGDSLMEQ
ncbi:hypothetical protein HK097_007682 [Rhizophlyctis rosea]|uniref:Fe2OG dioxygenase domain-containing protein n=1 Tax=Rhizophlyctis rosea TaxID=64517 RepID=A0AAD5SCS9_9FUNG|nr:hypothetical protein HK097_007682 [Rhizophlyctis rosea]